MTEEKKLEFTKRIGTANKTEMVVIVYDIALEYIADAAKALAGSDMAEYKKGLKGARKCVQDLINALNFDIEISNNLMSIYAYVTRKLILADMNREAAILDEISGMLATLREAFDTISKKDGSGPMSEHTQHVVAGMTYGKGVLNESVVNGTREFSV